MLRENGRNIRSSPSVPKSLLIAEPCIAIPMVIIMNANTAEARAMPQRTRASRASWRRSLSISFFTSERCDRRDRGNFLSVEIIELGRHRERRGRVVIVVFVSVVPHYHHRVSALRIISVGARVMSLSWINPLMPGNCIQGRPRGRLF